MLLTTIAEEPLLETDVMSFAAAAALFDCSEKTAQRRAQKEKWEVVRDENGRKKLVARDIDRRVKFLTLYNALPDSVPVTEKCKLMLEFIGTFPLEHQEIIFIEFAGHINAEPGKAVQKAMSDATS